MMLAQGEVWKDETTFYEVLMQYPHWKTKEEFILFASLKTGNHYILERSEFIRQNQRVIFNREESQ